MTGSLPRERVEDAAAKVVAVQTWQARVAGGGARSRTTRRRAPTPPRAALSAAAVTRRRRRLRPAAAPRTASWSAGGTDTDQARLRAAAERAGVPTGLRAARSGCWGARPAGGGDVVVSLDVPYVLERARGRHGDAGPVRARRDGAFDALVAVLTGASAPQGALPVSIGRTTSTDC